MSIKTDKIKEIQELIKETNFTLKEISDLTDVSVTTVLKLRNKISEETGIDYRKKKANKFSYETKKKAIMHFYKNDDIVLTAKIFNTTRSTIYNWVMNKEQILNRKNNKSKKQNLNENIDIDFDYTTLSKDEQLEYLRAENAYLKKLDALIREKEKSHTKKK